MVHLFYFVKWIGMILDRRELILSGQSRYAIWIKTVQHEAACVFSRTNSVLADLKACQFILEPKTHNKYIIKVKCWSYNMFLDKKQ